MNETALRPRYKFASELCTDEIRERLKTALKDDQVNKFKLQHRLVSHHLLISFPAVHRHFWSPTLDVNMEQSTDGKTTVRLLIGPEASIWTMFMFFYTVAWLAVLTGIVLGYSQYSLGKGVFLLWLIPVGLALFLIFYFSAIAGKSKAQEQMKQLMDFFKNAVGEDELELIGPE